jgi:hypothetical protein
MSKHEEYFELAAEQARQSLCDRAHCGSVIVAADGEAIGRGYNAPPLNDLSQKCCNVKLNHAIKPKYDKTCCVHAEWNAIIDALKTNTEKINGATLYFMRVNNEGEWTDAGEPFCTACSRLAMQSGLGHFALWVDDGPLIRTVKEYNEKSYDYYKK